MKLICLALALFIAGVASQQICLPNRFQWYRTQEWSGFNADAGFDLLEEYFDYGAQKFRVIVDTHVDHTETYQDILVWGKEKKVWVVNGTRGGGALTCQMFTQDFPIDPACLLANATTQGYYMMAGDTFVQNYFEEFTVGSGSNRYTTYQDIGLTVSDNIPVLSREVYSKPGSQDVAGNSLELYFNYKLDLDSRAFTPEGICPGSLDAGSPKFTAKMLNKVAPGFLIKRHRVANNQ